ncbi:MAG: ABC-F family ATP-binding cassette domain-containing protein [Rhodospirillales bacterium]|nr:ABC-F family ATP-binding cassette domain-containing protein [Rhodospirillales bacterium]
MIAIDNLTLRIGGLTLIEDATALIPEGRHVGLIGRNGAGKSTLLEAILGHLHPDQGSISMPKRARIGFVAQEAPGGATTPLEAVLAADEERAALLAEEETTDDGARIADIHMRLSEIDAYTAVARGASILAGLGFDTEMQNRPLSEFSGGWRMRVALAGVLFARPDILILDEPTNHLDLESALWLEDYLAHWSGTILVVSHDRRLLNAVCTHILHLDQKKLTLYTGDYDRFEVLRQERLALQAAMAAKVDAQRKHMQSFVDRFRAKASKAAQAQSRLKALAKLTPIVVERDEDAVRFEFPEVELPKPPMVTFDRATVGYETGKPILTGIDLRLDPEDRIGLLGANGNGKSTLAKLFAGRLQPMSGGTMRASKLQTGFFAQHQIEDIDPNRSPFQLLGDEWPKAAPLALRSRLARFGFSGPKADVKAENLSGGEKARLAFALATAHAPQLLILDEPTNHLDMASRERLVAAINDFAGAVILVTHDWSLLELTCDRLWLVAGGKVVPFEGDLDDYRQLALAERRAQRQTNEKPKAAPSAKRPSRDLGSLKRELKAAEEALAKLTAERQTLENDAALPSTYNDPRKSAANAKRIKELAEPIAQAEARWLAAAEAMEEANAA